MITSKMQIILGIIFIVGIFCVFLYGKNYQSKYNKAVDKLANANTQIAILNMQINVNNEMLKKQNELIAALEVAEKEKTAIMQQEIDNITNKYNHAKESIKTIKIKEIVPEEECNLKIEQIKVLQGAFFYE